MKTNALTMIAISALSVLITLKVGPRFSGAGMRYQTGMMVQVATNPTGLYIGTVDGIDERFIHLRDVRQYLMKDGKAAPIARAEIAAHGPTSASFPLASVTMIEPVSTGSPLAAELAKMQ